MTKSLGNCTDSTAFSPGGSSIDKRGEAVPQGFRQVDARAPEDLAVVFHFGQRIGTVGSDAAYARAYGEGNLHHLVEDRLVSRSAQPARIFLAIEGLEGRAGIEHAAAAGTEHVPRQLEQAEPRRVQEGGDHPLFIEAILGGEGERVDAAEVAIGRLAHRALDRGNTLGVGRLPQHAEKGFGFAHRSRSRSRRIGPSI
jgi:hypothetical protein